MMPQCLTFAFCSSHFAISISFTCKNLYDGPQTTTYCGFCTPYRPLPQELELKPSRTRLGSPGPALFWRLDAGGGMGIRIPTKSLDKARLGGFYTRGHWFC